MLLSPGEAGRSYRLPNKRDEDAANAAERQLTSIIEAHCDGLSPVPGEHVPKERPSPNARGLSAVTRMGVVRFGDLFTPRQSLALITLNSLVKKAANDLSMAEARAVRTVLALSVGKVADLANSCCRWEPVAECPRQLFARQAIPIVWDFPEGVPIGESSGSWDVMIERFCQFVATSGSNWNQCEPQLASATHHPLPDDSAAAFFTDPPYYDAVPYGDLSDFFYVWFRRALHDEHPSLFSTAVVKKDEEAIWNPSRIYSKTGKPKDELFYESQMGRALAEGRRLTIARYSAAIMPWTSHTAWPRRNSGPLDETGRRFSCPQRCVGGEAARLTTDLGDCIPVSTSAASRGSACREPTGPDKQRFTQRSDGQPNGCRTCADLEHDQRPVKRRREAALHTDRSQPERTTTKQRCSLLMHWAHELSRTGMRASSSRPGRSLRQIVCK